MATARRSRPQESFEAVVRVCGEVLGEAAALFQLVAWRARVERAHEIIALYRT